MAAVKNFWKKLRPWQRVVEEGNKVPPMFPELTHIISPQPYGVLVDATFGCGRHTKALKKRFPDLGVIAVDIDSCGFERAKGLRHRYSNPPSFTFVQANWSNLSLAVNKAGQKFFDTPHQADYVFFDLGLNNEQMFLPERGFLARQIGPLDMRLCNEINMVTAEEVVNEYDEEELFKIFSLYGGEDHDISKQFAECIVSRRDTEPFTDTIDLSKFLCEKVLQEHHEQACMTGPHPAEKAFLGLWTYCSKFYEEMAYGFREAEKILAPGGLLIIIAYHNLESSVIMEFEETRTLGDKPSFEKVFEDPLRCQDQNIQSHIKNRSALIFAYKRTENDIIKDEEKLSTEYLLNFPPHPAYDIIKPSSMPGRYLK